VRGGVVFVVVEILCHLDDDVDDVVVPGGDVVVPGVASGVAEILCHLDDDAVVLDDDAVVPGVAFGVVAGYFLCQICHRPCLHPPSSNAYQLAF
jgi:hypothetical protein